MDNVRTSIENDRVDGDRTSGPVSTQLAWFIMFFLLVFLIFSYLLKREYWKDLR